MKYDIIYADPPWEFTVYNKKTAQRYVGNIYNTMSYKELSKMDIPSNDNSVLFMWATFPNLELAISLISSWGFIYKTIGFVWIKTNRVNTETLFTGMGYYTRSNAEICLLATRGKPLKRMSHSVHSVVVSPIERHSKKPSIVRDRIVELFGDLPRIELFARDKVSGWDAWGNEIESDVYIA